MTKVFFPGCRIKAACPGASERLAGYMEKRHGLKAAGCCKEDYAKLGDAEAGVFICNNCVKEVSKLTVLPAKEFVLEYIDRDTGFVFPDYRERHAVLQDCGHGYDEQPMDDTVRHLLKKMNISLQEVPHNRRIPSGTSHREHAALVKENAAGYAETDVICYCGICRLALEQSGKNVHHILDLLFPEDGRDTAILQEE